MSQTRWQSMQETTVSTAIGFVISWAATPPILWFFGYEAGAKTAFDITCVYTAISLLRGWGVRRLFNRLHARKAA